MIRRRTWFEAARRAHVDGTGCVIIRQTSYISLGKHLLIHTQLNIKVSGNASHEFKFILVVAMRVLFMRGFLPAAPVHQRPISAVCALVTAFVIGEAFASVESCSSDVVTRWCTGA